MSATDNSYAAFLGLWHAADQLLASRGLPALDVEEATRLFRSAQDEEVRITFTHLRRAFCTGTCPHEAPPSRKGPTIFRRVRMIYLIAAALVGSVSTRWRRFILAH